MGRHWQKAVTCVECVQQLLRNFSTRRQLLAETVTTNARKTVKIVCKFDDDGELSQGTHNDNILQNNGIIIDIQWYLSNVCAYDKVLGKKRMKRNVSICQICPQQHCGTLSVCVYYKEMFVMAWLIGVLVADHLLLKDFEPCGIIFKNMCIYYFRFSRPNWRIIHYFIYIVTNHTNLPFVWSRSEKLIFGVTTADPHFARTWYIFGFISKKEQMLLQNYGDNSRHTTDNSTCQLGR